MPYHSQLTYYIIININYCVRLGDHLSLTIQHEYSDNLLLIKY